MLVVCDIYNVSKSMYVSEKEMELCPCTPMYNAHDVVLCCNTVRNVALGLWLVGVPCKRRSSVNSGAWLRRFDDVTGVAKTDMLHW